MFVMHASIAKPLGECGKLQLTTDMAELEFSLNAFLADGSQSKRSGTPFFLVYGPSGVYSPCTRSPLLFLENAHLASPERTAGLAPLVVLHHILVRSPLPLLTRFTGGKKPSTSVGSTSMRPRRPCRSSMDVSRIGRNGIGMGRRTRW
ncbi:hypothetical protein L210DRAFT_3585540, partial [Boletus edulis BED1]